MGKRVSESSNRFWTGVGIYVAVALVLIGIGLALFWNFLGAYEASRPRNTVADYLETLTPQHILDLAGEDLLAKVDERLRDEDGCKAQVLAALEGNYTYARNTSRSTEDTQVYALRLGRQIIGSFEMKQTGRSSWNFTPWEVTGEEFDLSYLLTEPVKVTVPEAYTVYVDGVPLPRECVVEEMTYDAFAELVDNGDNYDFPVMLRYETGPLLGEAAVTVTDGAGQPADLEFDPMAVLDNCTDEEKTAMDKTIRTFVKAYVNYTTRNTSDLNVGLREVKKLIVPGGKLALRMDRVQSTLGDIPPHQTAEVKSVDVNLLTRLDEGLYYCDITFTVQAYNWYHTPLTVSHAKMVFRQTDAGMLAEAMIILVE